MASDMRLNDKPIANDGAYIYAEAADGSQVKISKADLASVVAGVISPFRVYGNISENTSFDSIIKTGLYAQDGDVNSLSGLPDGYRNGSLIVFNCGYGTAGGGSPIIQFFIPSIGGEILLRVYWVSNWYPWIVIKP